MRDHIDSAYEKIDVVGGKLQYNYKCHLNAVHYAMKRGDKKVALVMYLPKGSTLPVVHFVNYHKGKFIDNTVGFWACDYQYRFVRWVHRNEFRDITTVLKDTKRFFTDQATPLEKAFGDISI
jgi:hypothetical protein